MSKNNRINMKISPTRLKLKNQINQFNNLEKIIYYIVTQVDGSLFSFLSGAVATVPITAAFNIVTVENNKTSSYLIMIIIYFAAFLVSCAMCVEVFKFTVKHMEINNYAEKENNREVYANRLAEKTIENRKNLCKSFVLFVLFTFILIALLISIFVINFRI